jgi:hypothetical protein
VSGVITFSPDAIAALRDRGFLTATNPSFDDLVVAAFEMLGAAWKAGIRAAEAPSSPPSDDDTEAARRTYFERLARATS